MHIFNFHFSFSIIFFHPSWCTVHHLRNKKISRISDSFASSVHVSAAHFSSTHTHTTLISSSSANPAPSKSEQTARRGLTAVFLGFLRPFNPSLHHSHLLLVSDKASQHQWRSTKPQKCLCMCVWRGRKWCNNHSDPKGFNSSFSRPIFVSRVKTQQLRKSCLAGQ